MKKMLMIGLCMAFLAVSSLAFAEDVYVTKNGKKYHKADCRWIKGKGAKPIDIKDAEAKGYEPCGRCFNEETSEGSADTKQVEAKKTEKKKK